MSINDDFVFFFSLVEIDWKQYSDGITMLLFQGDINYATGHGVVKLGDKVLLTSYNCQDQVLCVSHRILHNLCSLID